MRQQGTQSQSDLLLRLIISNWMRCGTAQFNFSSLHRYTQLLHCEQGSALFFSGVVALTSSRFTLPISTSPHRTTTAAAAAAADDEASCLKWDNSSCAELEFHLRLIEFHQDCRCEQNQYMKHVRCHAHHQALRLRGKTQVICLKQYN